MNKIKILFEELLDKYNYQGWWPLLSFEGNNPTKTGSIKGYHPKDYSFPKNEHQKFEICIGAILTQNTNWMNVEKTLINLNKINCLNPEQIINSDENEIKEAIKPAGFFNQKYKKIKLFSQFFIENNNPTRDELLGIWGIGPETADSILLYGYKQRTFVIDNYTKRILIKRNIINEDCNYDELKQLFEENLPQDFEVYQEFHALLVEEGKHLK